MALGLIAWPFFCGCGRPAAFKFDIIVPLVLSPGPQ